jgi:hypothetical protein
MLQLRVGELSPEVRQPPFDGCLEPGAEGDRVWRQNVARRGWPALGVPLGCQAGAHTGGACLDVLVLTDPSTKVGGADPQALVDLRHHVGEALQRGREPDHVANS